MLYPTATLRNVNYTNAAIQKDSGLLQRATVLYYMV